MIQTAEEFKKQYPYLDAMFGSAQEHESVIMLMTEFAKLHVEAALKIASEKGVTELRSEGNSDDQIVNKDSILNAYPLENIK